MTILATALAITALLGWLVALGTLMYGLIKKSSFVEGMMLTFYTVSLAAAMALMGSASLLGYEWE